MYLLDTNVVSESSRAAHADPHVAAWLAELGPTQWWVSVVTDYELELGVQSLRRRDPRQGGRLHAWLAGVRKGYASRLLPVGAEVGRVCARIQVSDRRQLSDAFIAATALHHGLTVVTRNEKDFEVPGLSVFNPFVG